jgi:penicillin-binding protein 2
LPVGDRNMGCLGSHGDINLSAAIARSCNIYFYEVGRRLGIDPLLAMSETLGFGRRTGLVHRNPQLRELGVPVTDGLHEANPAIKPGPYSITDAIAMAIGQNPLDDVTPLQVAAMMGAIGTGLYVAPHLVASIEGYGDVAPRPGVPLGIDQQHLAIVRAAMAEVVDQNYGTANDLALAHPDLAEHVAAKTGTAEVDHRRDHSWFAGFMPREQPRLAFAVLIEDCGFHGSEAALPVFLDLLQRPAMAAFLDAEILPRSPAEVAR